MKGRLLIFFLVISCISAFGVEKKPINKFDDIALGPQGVHTYSEELSSTDTSKLSQVSLKQYDNAVRLFSDPDNYEYKIAYLEGYPRKFVEFKQVFQPDDFGQLYDTSDIYLKILSVLCEELPERCGPIIVGLGKDAQYEADATGYLQMILNKFVLEKTDIFLDLFEKLSGKERDNLAYFMADYETMPNDPDYDKMLTEFKNRKKEEAYNCFLAAKKKLMRRGFD